jgi:hypothetical protein
VAGHSGVAGVERQPLKMIEASKEARKMWQNLKDPKASAMASIATSSA